MTNLIYLSKYYRQYKNSDSIIKELDSTILNDLISSCKPDDLFIYSTWFEVDSLLKELVLKKPKRAVVYSGMDWHDTGFRKDVHDYIKANVEEIKYVGNTDGDGYFSYWLFFIKKYFKSYTVEEVFPKKLDKVFMSLNRKRHLHRVALVGKLFEHDLNAKGLVTLGGDPEKNIAPLTLLNDISNKEGDKAVGNPIQGITNDITSLGNLENWNRCLINVVTETTHYSNTFISEKTWKPIIGLRPFIIIGDPGVYLHLKNYGIDTFDDIFGTGYKEENFNNRIDWAVNTIEKFKNHNLQELFDKLLPRLISNKNRMKQIFEINKNRYKNILKKLGN